MIQLAVLPFYVHSLLVLLFLAVSILMILVILIQKPQGGGLSGAFGAGASSGQTAFGARTGDMLTWLTVGMFCLFLIVAIVLNFTTRQNPFAAAAAAPTAIQGVPGSEGAGEGAVVPDSIPEGQPSEQPVDQPDEQDPDQQPPPGVEQPAAPTKPGETPTQGEPKTEPGQADPPKTNEGEADPPPPSGVPPPGL